MTFIACKFWEVQLDDVFTRGNRKWRKTGADRAGELYHVWAGEILPPNCEVQMSPTAWNRVGYGLTSLRRLRPHATFLLPPEQCLLHDQDAMFGRFYTTDRRNGPRPQVNYWAPDWHPITMPPDTPVLNARVVVGDPRIRDCSYCLGVHWLIQRQTTAANPYVVQPCPTCRPFGSVAEACQAARRCGIAVADGAAAGYIQDVSLPYFLRARRTFSMRVTVTHHADFENPYETILSRFKKSTQGTNCDIKYESLGAVLEDETVKPAPPRERSIQLD